jgi:hypothetical protein
MAPKRLDRQIDDLLLATASWAGFLYMRRRFRRLLSRAVVGTTAAAGIGAIGVAVAGAAWYRSRTHEATE